MLCLDYPRRVFERAPNLAGIATGGFVQVKSSNKEAEDMWASVPGVFSTQTVARQCRPSACFLRRRKFNPSHCFGCAYEFRATLGLLQSCSKILRRGILGHVLSNSFRVDDSASLVKVLSGLNALDISDIQEG